MINLRPYQKTAIDKCMNALIAEHFVLLQAATGAGKTEIFCELINRWITRFPGMKIAVVVHRQELVVQAYQRLITRVPELKDIVGMACSSAGKVVIDKPVIVGSVQTLCRRNIELFHLLIIDEAHNVAPMTKDSQYKQLIGMMHDRYQKLRILGVTATPYRCNHGYIYGKQCKKDEVNWFSSLCYSITLDHLIKEKYLVPLIAYEAEQMDVSSVRVTAGEYNNKDLGEVAQRLVHLESAVKVWKQKAIGRNSTLVFAVNIAHAKALRNTFVERGIKAESVHSLLNKTDRDNIINTFKTGDYPVLINVGILTEGIDIPEVDCILCCRPTLSTALYVQMLGRGSRIAPFKTNCLILDLAGNCTRHGNPSEPYVDIPKPPKPRAKPQKMEAGMKRCPACKREVKLTDIECIHCGFIWSAEDVKKMVKVDWSLMEMDTDVLGVSLLKHLKGYNESLRVTLTIGKKTVNQFFNLSNSYSYNNFCRWWMIVANNRPPKTIEQAVERQDEVKIDRVKIKKNGKYWSVAKWN